MNQVSDDHSAPRLDDRLSAAEDAIRTHYAAYLDAIADRLGALRSELEQARDRHAALRDDLSLDAVLQTPDPASSVIRTGATDWQAVWTRVCTYRQQMRKEILNPLRTHLDECPLGPVLVERRTTLVERLHGVVDDHPQVLTRPESDTLYAPDPADTWNRRLRKAWVRSRRQTRSVLGIDDDLPPTRTIPLGSLVRHHVTRLVERHRPVLDAIEDRLLGWLGDLERVFTSATHTLLEFEQRIDHLNFHHAATDNNDLAPRPASAPELTDSLDVPQAPPSTEVLASVRDELDALDAVLERGVDLSIDELRSALWQHVDDQLTALHEAAARPWPATTDEEPSPPSRDWTAWDEQARTRLRLCATMIAFYADAEEIRDDLIDSIIDEGPSVVRERLATLADDLKETDATLQELLADGPDHEALQAPLDEALAAVTDHLETLRTISLGNRLPSIVQSHLDALQARVDDLPETMTVHATADPDAPPAPSADAHDVPVRAGAEITFDVLFVDHVQSATQHIIDVLAAEIDRTEQLIDVLRFGRDSTQDPSVQEDTPPSTAALPHGRSETGGPNVPPPDTAPLMDDADPLVRGSVQRSIRLLRTRTDRVDAAAYEWADTVWHDFRRGMTRLHDQWTTESRFQNRVAQLTRQLAREARGAASDAKEQVEYGWLHLREGMVQARQWLDATRQALQSILGLTGTDPEAVSESVETIASLGTSLERLPIVYRRLFSFEPVDDPELFKGRDEERRFVGRYVTRWRRGLPASLLLVGERGSGLTSLLKVVRATTLQDATLHHLRLDARPDSEAQLAAQVARTLDLNLSVTASLSLDDVGQALRDAPLPGPTDDASSFSVTAPADATTPVRACFVEHLEQLLLQTVGGLDLLDRMLTLISRTDAHVLWIGTMSTAAWQLVEKRLPSAADLITHERVDPLGRDAIADAIMSRHRRSGLPLHFDAHDTGPLSSRSSQKERRATFFDRLHEASHQNVALALLYWFRSVEPRDDAPGLRVQPLQPISFRILDELTMEQLFALKAFLVHSSLTVEEYSQVAQIPTADSVDVMESLGNASLIEPVDGPAGRAFDVYFEAVAQNVRYRIRPLLVAPIVQHLKAHNIVH